MSSELTSLSRMSDGLVALLDAFPSREKMAEALLTIVPGAVSAECDLDGVTGKAGSSRSTSSLVRAEVSLAGRPRGHVGVRVPAAAKGCESILTLAARLIALRLPGEFENQRHLMELVTVGEAVGYLVHAINNHLNSIVLQAACVQMQSESIVREQAENIRQEGARAAARMRPLQLVHPWPALPGERVAVVATIRQVLRDEPELADVQARLPEEEIFLSASAMGMKRLLTLLLRVAQRGIAASQKLRVDLVRSKEIELTLVLPGARSALDQEGIHLPPEQEGGLHQVEREATLWLVRQSGGHLEVAETPEGVILTVRWEA